jgi:hypothetical protein
MRSTAFLATLDHPYSITVPVGGYEVAASAFGFEPQSVPVTITESVTTERNFPLAAPAGPHLSASPDPLDFGEVAVGNTGGPSSLTLTGIGAEPVTVSEASVPRRRVRGGRRHLWGRPVHEPPRPRCPACRAAHWTTASARPSRDPPRPR